MYNTNGEQCKKCGKLFHKGDKVIKMVDADGNELHIDLCNKCTIDSTVEEIMESTHISREDAEKHYNSLVDKTLLNILSSVEPYNHTNVTEYNNYWIEQTNNNVPKAVRFQNMASSMLKDEMPNAVVRVVKDNG